jgi:hypothetical protein
VVPKPLAHFLIAATVATVALLAVSHGDVNKMAYGDGLIYRYVAAHLSTPPDKIDPVVVVRGTSLRYGRIGLPGMIWLAAAAQPRAMAYSQAIIIILAVGFAGAATASLFPSSGPLGALLPLIAPGFTLSLVGGYAEVVAVALALWAVIFVLRDQFVPATALLAISLLTREDAGVVLIGLTAWLLLNRKPKPAATLWLSVIPLAIWYLIVKARYGHIPLFDPFLKVGTRTPFVAVWHSLVSGSKASIITAAIHVVLAAAAAAFFLWRRSILASLATASALQVVTSGVLAWQYVGDAIRVFTFLQLFLLLTVLALRWPLHIARPSHETGHRPGFDEKTLPSVR